jgi:iron complex outermembrane receptor protein
MKRIFITGVMIFLYIIINAQNKITGRIIDQDSLPLTGASVTIPEINKGTITDRNGHYEINNLPNGKLKIQYTFIGFASKIESAVLAGSELVLNQTLKSTVIEAEEIVVTGGYNSTQHENAVKIDVLKLNMLNNKATSNFAELLTKVPGVDMISKGNGVSKPVIRGLSMNDILVLNNGLRFENYQYSSHHPLGIDEFGIDDIEIIKGPASLLYGSDAIGGVINFIKEKPALQNSIVGDFNTQVFSNSMGMSNNLGIKGASEKLFAGLRVGQKTNSDYLQGGGNYVPNSRFNEYSVKTNAGYSGKTGTFKLFYDYNRQNLGLVEEESIGQIDERDRECNIFYQQLNTHLMSSHNKLFLGKLRIDANASYQNTELIHFGEIDAYEIQMKLATLTYETKLYLPSDKNSEYIIGIQGINQQNTNLNDRQTKLLPDASTDNYSAFALLQLTFFTRLKLQTGVRYDYKIIGTKAIGIETDSLSYRKALDKNYSSFSGSIGATFSVSDELLFRANIASAYRTPNLAELTSNGQHETNYEVGDQKLAPENSYEGDLSIHFHQENITVDLAAFINTINNYIFIAPTGDTTASGVSIYKYTQRNSVLFGGEAGMHLHPSFIHWLHFEATFSSVTGKQENGDYLPFVPAHKLNIELRGEKENLFFVNRAFVSLNSSTAFDQNNAAPDETITSGYTLIDISAGGDIKSGKQNISIALSANNIFDVKYIDHLSTLKEVGLYNPGRNFTFSVKIPFVVLFRN